MKWQYEPVEPNQPPVVLLLHYRTREELTQIMAPHAGQVSHAHAMMRAAAAASSSLAERSGPIDHAAMSRNDLGVDFNDDSAAGQARMPLDDDGIKIGLRRTFSNSSCGSFSDAVFKSEHDHYMTKDIPFDRRRNHLTDLDDVPSSSSLMDPPKPSPLLLPQSSPQRGPLRSPPQLTSPGTFLSVPTP